MIRGIWAVAETIIREAFRSRLFLIFLFFAVLVIGVIPLMPTVGPEDKAKFISFWSLGAANVVAGLAMIFFVALSLPREFEEKTLNQVLIKPIGRFAYSIGRLLGYGLISIGLFLGMGLMSYFALLGQSADLGDVPLLNPARLIEAEKVEVQGEPIPSKDWEITKWLSGVGKVVYDFPDFREHSIKKQNAKLYVALPGSLTGEYQSICQVKLSLQNLTTGKSWESAPVIGQEVQKIDLVPEVFEGKLRVVVSPLSGGIGLDGRKWPLKLGVRILEPNSSSVFINWMNTFFIKGLSVVLLIACSFAFSSLISGKFALVLSAVIFLAGSFPSYSFVMGRMLRGEVEMVEIEAHSHEHDLTGDESEKKSPLPPGFSILAGVADGFASVIPDLDRFDMSADMVAGYNVSFRRDLELFLYLLVYLAISIGVSGLVFKLREIG